MADINLQLRSERWLDEIVLDASKSNVGADVVDNLIFPQSVGDVAIMEILIYDFSQATPISTVELSAVVFVQSSAGQNIDFVGSAPFRKVSATGSVAYISPDPLVQVKSGEELSIAMPELDSNASPTDDILILVKAVRVRPQEVSEQPRPLRLVR